jgi:hypothetical protein
MGEAARAGRTCHLCTCSAIPLSMGPETSLVGSCASNHLCIYDLYSLLHNVLMSEYPLLGQVGGGWALEISSYLCPK